MVVSFLDHWLVKWMDEYEISSTRDFDRALQSGLASKSLHQSAAQESWRSTLDRPGDSTGYEVLASRKLDLSGISMCTCERCLSIQLEESLVRALPYFDKVVFEGPNAGHFAWVLSMPRARGKNDDLYASEMGTLRSLARCLLQLRQNPTIFGSIAFAPKPMGFCLSCQESHAEKYHVPHGESLQPIRDALRSARIEMIPMRSGGWRVRTGHELTDGYFVREYSTRARPSKKQIISDVAEALIQPTVVDLAASERHRLPLIDGYAVGRVPPSDNSVNEQAAALAMNLPVLRGIDLQTFAELKEKYEPSFLRFQLAIRSAMTEHLKEAVTDQNLSTEASAKLVMKKYIEPELAEIDQQLGAATRSLKGKLALSSAVGTAITAVGLLGSIPLGVTTGVAAVMTGLVQGHKYLEDRSKVETHDLHFLWEVRKSKEKHSN